MTNEELKAKAKELRKNIIEMIYTAKSGHPGGSLSYADIATVLYYDEMKLDAKNPRWADRDRFILSKGHACPTIYSLLAMKGFYPMEELGNLRKINGMLQGHPDMNKTPGIDYTAGSLGNGLSIGVGMALAAQLDKKDYRTFVMLGCGEMQEGMLWEAMMSAVKFKCDNLCAIIDYNKLQLDGNNDEVMPMGSMNDKLSSFGWNVIECNGHDIQEIKDALKLAKETKEVPTAIIANTIKGKGVSYMEDKLGWHGVVPNKEQYEQAMKELEANNG